MNSQVPCCPTHHCELEFFGTTGTSESPTDDLRCMWCEFLRLKEENAVLRSQVENADINLEQVRMAQKAMWKTRLEWAEHELKTAQQENSALRSELEELRYSDRNGERY